MSEDVLVKWADRLEWAATWAGHASNFNKSEDFCCIHDLAAEVRALRKRIAFEKAKIDQFVAEALAVSVEQEAEVRELREENASLMATQNRMTNLASRQEEREGTIRELQARLAELEKAEEGQNIRFIQGYMTRMGLPDDKLLAVALLKGATLTTDYLARTVTITSKDGTVLYVKGWEEPC